MSKYEHVVDPEMRRFLEAEDPGAWSFDQIADLHDACEVAFHEDEANEDVPAKSLRMRNEALDEMRTALSDRNRFEFQGACRYFWSEDPRTRVQPAAPAL